MEKPSLEGIMKISSAIQLADSGKCFGPANRSFVQTLYMLLQLRVYYSCLIGVCFSSFPFRMCLLDLRGAGERHQGAERASRKDHFTWGKNRIKVIN
jgi:hypothetical protein